MLGRTLLVGAAAVVWALVGASPGNAAPVTHQVIIVNFSFSPKSLSVQAGDTVVWTNQGSVAHTVTADNGSFNSGSLSPGQSFSQTFASSGIVAYHCMFHGAAGGIGMSGRITVNAAPVATTVPTTPPTTTAPVTAPGATTAPPPTSPSSVQGTVAPATSAPELAHTGANDVRMSLLAFALVVSGLVGVSATRSRMRNAKRPRE
jgi:plastocyanin